MSFLARLLSRILGSPGQILIPGRILLIPSTQEIEAEDFFEFQANLNYRASSRTVRATQRNFRMNPYEETVVLIKKQALTYLSLSMGIERDL